MRSTADGTRVGGNIGTVTNSGTNTVFLDNNEGTVMTVPVVSSDPSNPVEGQFVFNTTESTLKIYVGSAWYTIASKASTVGVTALSIPASVPTPSVVIT